MNKCNNPECQKEIEETKKYCSEQCLKRHLEIKNTKKYPSLQFIENSKEGIHEIQEICDIFGFKHTDGMISGQHNATILGYLRMHKEEVYNTTIDKLTWICHTSNRNIRENYMKGIEAFGIIQTFTNEFNVLKWRWVGVKALRNNGDESQC